jgi:hypothetical protein
MTHLLQEVITCVLLPAPLEAEAVLVEITAERQGLYGLGYCRVFEQRR